MHFIYKQVIAVFLWNAAILYLDYIQLYYYFQGLIYSIEWIYALMVITYFYLKVPRQTLISIPLAAMYGYAITGLLQNTTATVIYLSNRTRSLSMVERFIDNTQIEWLSVHYFISGLFALFVFFYFVINWDKWLEV